MGGSVEGGYGAVANLVGGAGGWDGDEDAEIAVEVDERSGGFGVSGETDLDGFGTIVFAAEERGTAVIADAFALGRLTGDMEDGFALGAGATSAKTRNNFWDRKVVVDDRVEWEMFLFEKIVESFGLREGAGEAVEQEATVAMKAASAFADQVPNRGVWNECATTHEGERFGHGRRWRAIGAGCGAENVAGGEMASTEFFVEELRLRTFADAGSAEKNDTPGGSLFLSLRSTLGGRALEPSGAIRLFGVHGETFVAAKVFG